MEWEEELGELNIQNNMSDIPSMNEDDSEDEAIIKSKHSLA